jgi:hypothetical protein
MVSQVMENQKSEREGDMMHPQFRIDLLHERQHQLELHIRRTYRLSKPAQTAPITDDGVALRLCSVHDDAALEQLAVLEGRAVPTGRLVLAEVNGTIVAALPLNGGEPLADPFRATAHLLPLMRLRASQLERATGTRARLVGALSLYRGRA